MAFPLFAIFFNFCKNDTNARLPTRGISVMISCCSIQGRKPSAAKCVFSFSPDISWIAVARPRRWVCHLATVPRYRGIGSEAYLNGTSQGPTPEDARKGVHIRGRSHAKAWWNIRVSHTSLIYNNFFLLTIQAILCQDTVIKYGSPGLFTRLSNKVWRWICRLSKLNYRYTYVVSLYFC